MREPWRPSPFNCHPWMMCDARRRGVPVRRKRSRDTCELVDDLCWDCLAISPKRFSGLRLGETNIDMYTGKGPILEGNFPFSEDQTSGAIHFHDYLSAESRVYSQDHLNSCEDDLVQQKSSWSMLAGLHTKRGSLPLFGAPKRIGRGSTM